MMYHKLIITAAHPKTDIWLADDEGNLVQKETGVMNTSLLPGTYKVRFGINGKDHLITLSKDSEYHEEGDV